MNPADVNPPNFDKKFIIYDNSEFSIAFGVWIDGEIVLGMRWNNNYPNDRYGKPIWFKITKDLTEIFLIALLNSNKITKIEYYNILESLKTLRQTYP